MSICHAAPLVVDILRMPFEAAVLGVEQVGVLHAADVPVLGQAGHGGEAVGRAQRRGVDVEVDVAVGHQQPRAERPYQTGFGADRAPDRLESGRADDLAGAPLVRGSRFKQVFHGGFCLYLKKARSLPVGPVTGG